MSDEIFELVDVLETESGHLELVRTVLSEMSYDLNIIITFDGSKEDKERQRNLLDRRKVLSDFLSIATSIVFDSVKNLKAAVETTYAKGREVTT